MVRIIYFVQRTSQTGEEFFSLIVQGSPEVVCSVKTNTPYVKARRCSISSTFDEKTCKALVESLLPGKIIKVEVEEPYEYIIPETNEKISLQHIYEYFEEPTTEDMVFSDDHY